MHTSLFVYAALAVAAPFCLWSTFITMCISPTIQRHVLYAHKVVPWWEDVNDPQLWGFAKNQVTPFHIPTEDGEKIHAWHILPLSAYLQHENVLRVQPTGLCRDIAAAESFRLLKEDPEARLIIYLHGNVGHIPSAIRSPSFHLFTATSNYHVLAIDYRGFGLSTGIPSEAGLIFDASAAIDFALGTVGLPPGRIVLLGHSLGSAAAAAVAERYAKDHGVDFAGIVMISAFSSLPNMLADYQIAGRIPILKPLRSWPRILNWFLGRVAEKWETADRLRGLVGAVRSGQKDRGSRHLRLSLIHAADDWDIPCTEDDKLFAAAVAPLLNRAGNASGDVYAAAKEEHTTHFSENAFVTEWTDGDMVIRQELFPHGGHNRIVLHAPVALEVMRAFGGYR